MLVKISWRNLWRHPVRSLMIMSTVMVGIYSGVLLMSFYNGIGQQRVTSSIEKEISHLQFHHPAFKTDYNLKYFIPDGPAIADNLRKDTLVRSIASRTVLQGMAATASGSTGIIITGIDPEEENETTGLHQRLVAGNYFSGIKSNQVLISRRLADKLHAKLGGKLILTYSDSSDELAAGAFKVCGFFESNNGPYDDSHLFVKRIALNSSMNLGDAVYEIAVRLKENDALVTAATLFRSSYPTVKIETWKEIAPEVNYIVEAMDRMLYIFMSVIFLAIAFGIINTMHMSILERTRELGMLMALGMNNIRIFLMIVVETVILVLAGSPPGILLSYLTVSYLHRRGIDLRHFEKTMSSFGYDQIVYPVIDSRHYLMILSIVGFTAILSAVFPARRAMKIIPMKAIRK